MKTNDTNINVTDQYIQAQRDIGSTTFFNLNNDSKTTVPWGHWDWITNAMAFVVMGFITYGLGHLAKFW